MVREYELLLILRPDLEEKDALSGVKKIFADHELEVTQESIWGLRTLAYPIKKQKQGRYVLFVVSSQSPKTIQAASQELRILDELMRFTLIGLGKK
ncbi:30S ribosomal protein S6 [candidate division WWE3 bacterium CG_4_9_14_3_um_filter_41_6]|uniref:Small ribosomal subunit protein bS6 n=1 Tax=candidate division WWE3 bacterium CG_4_10_14_0_2_um_filter_41_14 TaxID=1975072 RepID=A0A2M7TF98_UNCKA|nr:MAG: 30S ribosomal protein S6 [candidate division WWE3 bacterium CG_4_10_14_0_2_um_filter_41_14]PJA38476.1 MAG: 30S ribosomal protein S6 [candidate division WWE3 bacterium CG_4_9_14_3_um_filter_41_6]